MIDNLECRIRGYVVYTGCLSFDKDCTSTRLFLRFISYAKLFILAQYTKTTFKKSLYEYIPKLYRICISGQRFIVRF